MKVSAKSKEMVAMFATIFALSFTTIMSTTNSNSASAHFLGAVKNVGDYQIVFQSSPRYVSAGQNTSLNFSILDKKNSNVNSMYAALVMKEKSSGRVVEQMPYKFHEFSDISIPYAFHNNTDYVITLLARLNNGDQKYLSSPLVADFDMSVQNTRTVSPTEILLTVAPITMALAGGVIFLFKKNGR
jgi:hypothetical protein